MSLLRLRFESSHGYWSDELEDLPIADPRYLKAYDRRLNVTSAQGNLTPKEREPIYVAVTDQLTYLNRAATAHHIRQAQRLASIHRWG